MEWIIRNSLAEHIDKKWPVGSNRFYHYFFPFFLCSIKKRQCFESDILHFAYCHAYSNVLSCHLYPNSTLFVWYILLFINFLFYWNGTQKIIRRKWGLVNNHVDL